MLKEKLFDGKSQVSRFVFKSMLSGLGSPFRKHVNNPEKLVKASGIQAGQTVLEVGCGSGFFTVSVSEAVGEKGSVHAIDLHPVSVEETSKKIQTQALTNVKVSKADAHNTNFADASFDLILLYGVVPAPVISLARLTKEMHRLLKTGGTLAVWTVTPLWSLRAVTKTQLFRYQRKKDGVFQFEKIGE